MWNVWGGGHGERENLPHPRRLFRLFPESHRLRVGLMSLAPPALLRAGGSRWKNWGWDSTEKVAALLPHSKSAGNDGLEVGFAAEDQGGADHMKELLTTKVGK
jgi:hypothetical protein